MKKTCSPANVDKTTKMMRRQIENIEREVTGGKANGAVAFLIYKLVGSARKEEG